MRNTRIIARTVKLLFVCVVTVLLYSLKAAQTSLSRSSLSMRNWKPPCESCFDSFVSSGLSRMLKWYVFITIKLSFDQCFVIWIEMNICSFSFCFSELVDTARKALVWRVVELTDDRFTLQLEVSSLQETVSRIEGRIKEKEEDTKRSGIKLLLLILWLWLFIWLFALLMKTFIYNIFVDFRQNWNLTGLRILM